jgi:hypothetical protein
LIPASPSLVWALLIVVLLKLLSDALDLFQTLRPMNVEALFFVASVVPLNVSIFLWLMWRAETRLNLDAEQKAPQGRGKIPSTGPADPARIMVKRHVFGTTMLTQELNHRLQSRLGVEILMGLGRE